MSALAKKGTLAVAGTLNRSYAAYETVGPPRPRRAGPDVGPRIRRSVPRLVDGTLWRLIVGRSAAKPRNPPHRTKPKRFREMAEYGRKAAYSSLRPSTPAERIGGKRGPAAQVQLAIDVVQVDFDRAFR